MLIFDQLRISDNGKRMYIDAHVSLATQFTDTAIEKLYICLGSQVYETKTICPESNGYIYTKDYAADTKEIHEVIEMGLEGLEYSKENFSQDLFFVYVKCSGVPEDGSCYTAIGNYMLGVTFDENLLYQKVMDYTKELVVDCDVPTGFTDFILLWNAFKAAVETEHYLSAVKFYDMLFDKSGHGMTVFGATKHCGCHG